MENSLYNPFNRFDFNKNICFLSGIPKDELLPVFPDWLSDRFNLDQKLIKLLDESVVNYQGITLPVSFETKKKIQNLRRKSASFSQLAMKN